MKVSRAWHINVSNKLTVLLRSADQNGCRAGSETEIVLEDLPATRELVATPIAVAAIAEADVVGRRQAVSTKCINASRSTTVYVTGTSAEVADCVGTECNNCVQYIAFGKICEVADIDRFTMESNFGVGGLEPTFELFHGHQINLVPGKVSNCQCYGQYLKLKNIPLASALQRRGEKKRR